MSKTINFKRVRPATAEEWIHGVDGVERERLTPAAAAAAPAPLASEAMKRFTIDVPAALHTRIKIECARRGVKMADMLREMLESEFPEKRVCD